MTAWIVGIFLAFFAARWVVETGLLWLNLRHVKAHGAEVPEPLRESISPETAARSRDYTLARGRLGLVRDAYDAVLVLAVLFSGLLPGLEDALGAGGLGLHAVGPPGLHLGVAFLAVLGAIFGVAHLPFSLIGTFGIEQRFGFNRQTIASWLADRAKGLAVSAVLGLPFLYGVVGLMTYAGEWWWLWVFAFITAYQLVLVWLYPTLIAPIFNRFTPLPEGELKSRVEALAHSAGFRTKGLYTMDASRRTGHSNAYFTGMGRAKRIVLFDTMLEQLDTEQTLAVLAHEIGHFRLQHIRKRLVLGVGVTLLSLWVLSLLAGWPALFAAFGFADPSAHALLALVALGGGVFTFFLAPLGAWYSRRHEYAADAYSVALARAPEALKTALVAFSDQNLSNLHPHPWYSAYYYSHPTLLQRLTAIDRAIGASPGPAPAAPAAPQARPVGV